MNPCFEFAAGVLVSVVVAALSPPTARAGNDGSVDTTFHNPTGFTFVAGTITQQVGVPAVVDVLSLPDGKVVVVSNAAFDYSGQNGTHYTNAIRVQRLLPDGSADLSFGSNGQVEIASPYQANEYYQATSAALDPNGRIAIAGLYQENFYPRQSMAMWVLTPQGELDDSFAPNGMYVLQRYQDWSQDEAMDILAFGPREWHAGLDDDYRFALAGAFIDGEAPGDVTSKQGVVAFVTGGSSAGAILPFSGVPSGCSDDPLHALAARTSTDGSRLYLYAAGTKECDSGGSWAYVFAMKTIPGGVDYDGGFGFGGVSYFSYTADLADSRGESVAIDAQGRPVVAGTVWLDGGWNRFGVARLTTTGAFDSSFDGDGTRDVYFTNAPLTDPSRINVAGVLIQHDGKIIVGGDVEQRYIPGVFFTMRMNGNGTCDNTWAAPNTLSFMAGTPSTRNWVDCAGWYYSPTGAYVEADHVIAAAMSFTEGERLLLLGSIPEGNDGVFGLLERLDNDSIFADNFSW